MNDYITEKTQKFPTDRKIIAEMKVLFIEMMRSHRRQMSASEAS